MPQVFDRILVTVPDLAVAAAAYSKLLGAPERNDPVAGCATWVLANTAIEVSQRVDGAPAVSGLVLTGDGAGEQAAPLANPLGLDLRTCDGSAMTTLRKAAPERQLRIDHLVLRTADADACIALFGDQLGIRLALDKTVPRWGGRMLFFRGGKMTLEVIDAGADGESRNYFWGIAYQCDDIDSVVADLTGRGVVLSGVREGRKPGTRVATIKSHCLEIPSLLIQQA
ncbi:MAG: hypothetical protein HKN19_06295 [Halioglobus sp.]|nr:hypothetical protein [Halioglobus sp.]